LPNKKASSKESENVMPKDQTIATLFELAIGVEKAAEELYRGLEARFAHHQEIADFWKEYAAEEASHAQKLERLRDALDRETLAAPADPDLLQDARKILEFSTDHTVKEIKTLEDAYQLVKQLEDMETNAIFLFLLTDFSLTQNAHSFLKAQMKSHIAKITTRFPVQFQDASSRRAVRALDQASVPPSNPARPRRQ
jgi:rubrerythrin